MNSKNSSFQTNTVESLGIQQLERRDLVGLEPRLREKLREVLNFQQGLLYFPKTDNGKNAEYLPDEKTLLLPLRNANEELLAVFSAKGVPDENGDLLLPHLAGIAGLCIENLTLYKDKISDPLTGLVTRERFIRLMSHEIEALREGLRQWALPEDNITKALSGSGAGTGSNTGVSGDTQDGSGKPRVSTMTASHSCCFGVLSVRLGNFSQLIREQGQAIADSLLLALSRSLEQCLGGKGLAARSSEDSFAVLLPQSMPKASNNLALTLSQCLSSTGVYSELMATQVRAKISIGLASCPQDLGGLAYNPAQIASDGREQAKMLLRKAENAALIAEELPGAALWPPVYGDPHTASHCTSDSLAGNKHPEGVSPHVPAARLMRHSRILHEGGRINEILPLSRVGISLGHESGVMEGMRFAVWGMGGGFGQAQRRPLYKGEISILDVKRDSALAELHSLTDPSIPLVSGDRLTLLPDMEKRSPDSPGAQSEQRDSLTGLLRHGDFLAAWSEQREKCANFTLALIRLAHNHEQMALLEQWQVAAYSKDLDLEGLKPQIISPEEQLCKAAELCRAKFGPDLLGGRYGLSSLIFFHPEKKASEIKEIYEEISREITSFAPVISSVAIGLAPHPFLHFRRSEALENCRKALDYAMLLPEPHVGITDSLALNISADKHLSSGDSFGALEEYKLAILADESNTLAWNSLGVCLAELGRGEEARHYFDEVLKRDPDDLEAHYNLGQISQSLGALEEAEEHYNRCLSLDPEHVFAHLRLGQIAEQKGDSTAARKLYEATSRLKGGEGLTSRHLSRLCLKEGLLDEARSHLYEALEHNPQDAVARHLMAELYLEGGEDPEMAESQARQAVLLAPQLKQAWLTLAKALEAGGKTEQAREARFNAGKL